MRDSLEKKIIMLNYNYFQRSRRSVTNVPHNLDARQIQSQIDLAQEKSSQEKSNKASEYASKIPVPNSGDRPSPKFSNLYGVIDTNKLKSLFGGEPEPETHRSAPYICSDPAVVLDSIPEAIATNSQSGRIVEDPKISRNDLATENNPYTTHSKF